MAETPKLTLNNWSLGMSADEYAGGSFFYAEGINSDSNSKSFKLGHSIVDTAINNRTTGYAVAQEYDHTLDEEGYVSIGMLGFSADGYIESNGKYRALSSTPTYGGGLYRRPSGGYVNGIKIGDQILGITADKIDRITTTSSLWGSNLVNTPDLTATGTWTIGAGWAIGVNGATHTSGTEDISQTITTVIGKTYRINIGRINNFAGSLEVSVGATVLGTITAGALDYGWEIFFTAIGTSSVITLTPTDTFSGSIYYVGFSEYDSTKLLADDITITSATRHPLYMWQGDLYIGSGASIDIINTTDWDVRTVNVIESSYNIKSITQQGGSLVIWASNGISSRQYYRNGVDEAASEIINRPYNNIAAAIADETKTYVVTSNNWDRGVFIASGYQRYPIAKNVFNGRTIERSRTPYNINKRFNFWIDNVNQSIVFNDKFYVRSYGGLYCYGTNIVGMQAGWSKPIRVDETTTTIHSLGSVSNSLYIANRKLSVNYISQVYEYNYTTSGYLVTQAILRDNLSTKKALNKLKIGFKNVKSTIGNIKIYAIVDDDYFWRYQVTNVTTRPVVGDTYNVGKNTVGEIIAIENNGTTGMITFKTTNNTANYPGNALSSITKVTGSGQASISTGTLFDNMCLIKTITSDQQGYGEELIFGSSFVDTHMPDRHKIQLVIELNSNNSNVSPEVYDISLLSDIVNADV